MLSFENVSSKCILKLPWIGLQTLKYIFGKAGCSQTFKIKAQTPLFRQLQENFVTVRMGLHVFSQICGCLPQNFLYGASFHICLLF